MASDARREVDLFSQHCLEISNERPSLALMRLQDVLNEYLTMFMKANHQSSDEPEGGVEC